MRGTRSLAALACIATCLLASGGALAQALTQTMPRVLPFTGHLEQDGQAVSATRSMQFRVYASPTACAAQSTPDWQTTRQVPVFAGAFAVLLGDVGAGDAEFPPALFRSAPLALRITVDGSELQGCQVVHALPHSQRSAGDVPLGTVIDWWRPDTSVTPPEGYKICDGTAVSDARSPFNGKTVPDLRNRFVRGAQDATGIGTTGGTDVELAHQDNTHNHGWSYFTTGRNYYSYRQDGVGEQLINYDDGIGNEGTGNYLVGLSATVTGTRVHYTSQDAHAHAPPTNLEGNVPRYVGLLKLVRIY